MRHTTYEKLESGTMKKRTLTLTATAACAVLVCVAIRQCGLPKLTNTRNATGKPASTQSDGQTQVSVGGQKSQQSLPRPQTPEDILKRHNAGASGFDSKVRFWGKVLDQDGHPVEGVSIRASVTTLRMIKTENGYREFELMDTQSQSDGTFMFDGAEGFSLTIEKIAKMGYVLPSAYQEAMRFPEDFKYRFTYNSMGGPDRIFCPDPSSPFVFRLWKLRNPEPLFMEGSWAGFRGPTFQIDGEWRKLSMAFEPGGKRHPPDISIEVTSVGTQQSPQWEVTVAVIEDDGGVVKADPDDAFMFEAPAAGYQRVQKFRYGRDSAEQYDEGTPVRFFVRSKKGRWHSAVDTIFYPPDANGQIVTKWRNWLNPNGSRNLEHDSANPILVQDL